MQIHEITKRQKLNEIDLSAIKNAFASVTPTAAAKAAKASMYGGAPKEPKWEDKYKEVQNNPEVLKYIQRVMAGWKQAEPKQPATPPIQEAGEPNIMIGSEVIKPTDPRYAKFAQAAKPTTPNTATPPADDPYTKAFLDWSSQQLMSRDSVTGETITVDKVNELPGLKQKLSTALGLIAQTRGTPQQTKNIEEYLKLAVAGVQTLAEISKNTALKSGTLKGKVARPTGNTVADALLRQAGFTL
jgi:hypothetical protein